jgi:hypothetical protein
MGLTVRNWYVWGRLVLTALTVKAEGEYVSKSLFPKGSSILSIFIWRFIRSGNVIQLCPGFLASNLPVHRDMHALLQYM